MSDVYASIALGAPVCTTRFPRHSLFRRVMALVWAIRIVRAFDAGGSTEALRLLSQVPRLAHAVKAPSTALQVYQARIDAASVRSWLHLLIDARACFSESLALCAGLWQLGWSCYVIVGYAQVEAFVPTPLHAWVEYEGIPISDPLDVRYGYVELQRYTPMQEEYHAC